MIRPEGVSADDYQEQSQELMRRAPINRFARPEEIAEAVAYLASEQASYVNGFALWVEGGSWAGESAGMRRHEQG
jgi:NAD(P)-dependent dehydrogenase (short-subunit alcohol dehydrogenase family)